MPLFLLLACASPEEQSRQQAAAAAAQEADQNRCMIQGFEVGTDAFAQCVRVAIDQQHRPHRCTYCRSVD
jgi:hypothetical protein